jgi:hypothetical protein
MYVRGNPVMLIDPNGMYDDIAKAQKAQKKAVRRYGDSNVGDVYYDKSEKEYGFRISETGFKQHKGDKIIKGSDASASGGKAIFGNFKFNLYKLSHPTKEEYEAPLFEVDANLKYGGGYEYKQKLFGLGLEVKASGTTTLFNVNWNSNSKEIKTSVPLNVNVSGELGAGPFFVGENSNSNGENTSYYQFGMIYIEPNKNIPISFNVIELGRQMGKFGADIKVSMNPFKAVKEISKYNSEFVERTGFSIQSFNH